MGLREKQVAELSVEGSEDFQKIVIRVGHDEGVYQGSVFPAIGNESGAFTVSLTTLIDNPAKDLHKGRWNQGKFEELCLGVQKNEVILRTVKNVLAKYRLTLSEVHQDWHAAIQGV